MFIAMDVPPTENAKSSLTEGFDWTTRLNAMADVSQGNTKSNSAANISVVSLRQNSAFINTRREFASESWVPGGHFPQSPV